MSEMPLEEAIGAYSRHPTGTPASELYLTQKWMRLCVEVYRLRRAIEVKDNALRYIHERVEDCSKWSKDGNCIVAEALAFLSPVTGTE